MQLVTLFTLLLCLITAAPVWSQGTITSVAGRGRILTGIGGQATNVSLAIITDLAADSDGNLYIADKSLNVVLKVSVNGIATVFAGNGSRGFSGDGGPATQASLDQPTGLATDTNGNVYISDTVNGRIRKVSPAGIITTVAGGGPYVYPFSLNDGGPATSAYLLEPVNVAVDAAGNIYVVVGPFVRKVTPTGIITTFAGNPAAANPNGFSGDGGPATDASFGDIAGLAVDTAGNVYISDPGNQRIRRVGTDGIVNTVVGNGSTGSSGDGGLATSAGLDSPFGIAFDPGGNLYIADKFSNRIRMVRTATGVITTVAGSGTHGFSGDGGPATNAALRSQEWLAIDPTGNIFIGDTGNRRVRKVNAAGIMTTFVGNGITNFSGDGGPATEAAFDFPSHVALDKGGNLYVSDRENHRVRKITVSTGMISTIAGTGSPGYSGDGGPAVNATLNKPESIALDSAGNIYVTDSRNARVRKIDAATSIITTFAGGGDHGIAGDGGPATSADLFPAGICFDGNGNLYITDWSNVVRKVSSSGIITTIAGSRQSGYSGDGGPATQAKLNSPASVAVDGAGNVYIVDTNNKAIRKVDTSGIITTVAGPGYVNSIDFGRQGYVDNPQSIVIDDEGNLYVTAFYYVLRITSEGQATVLVNAENIKGFSGDGGPARRARISRMNVDGTHNGLALDGAGNLYIADTGNDRIRKVSNVNSPELLYDTHIGPFYSDKDGNTRPLDITNIGTGTISWTASISSVQGGSWLSVSPVSGTAPSRLTLTANMAGLPVGSYTAMLTISSDGTSNSPIDIPVFLNISSSATLNFVRGWNLVGNSSSGSLDATTAFGNTSNVLTAWKWIANEAKWAFYAPSLTGQDLNAYAASKGYDVLTMINGGEGFWVNAKAVFTAQMPAGTAITSTSFQTMAPGWNLIAIGDNITPSAFNKTLSPTPLAEDIPINITTLWAWDPELANWYFYAPSLEKSGGLAAYITSKGYLDFGTNKLDPAIGFWVNKP